jgi:hypothetical protein
VDFQGPYGFIAAAYSSADEYCRAVAICEGGDDFPTGSECFPWHFGVPGNLVRLPSFGNGRHPRQGH